MRSRALLALLALALPLAACSEDDDEAGDAGGGAEIAVLGSDTECTPASTEIAAGKTTFVFTNSSKQVSEIYVKTEADKVLREVENVPTGQIRKLTVTLDAGKTYKLNCKPGQKGDGITTAITVK